MIRFFRCLLLLLAFTICLKSNGQSKSLRLKGSEFKLVFQDEFTAQSLDNTKWVIRTDSKHWSTQLPANVRLDKGRLFLDLKKESSGDKSYTGAGIISKDSFLFGYYEAKFKLPPGSGWHMSFWLMKHDGSGGTNPSTSCLEIDIVENDSKHGNSYNTNTHKWYGIHKDFGWKSIPSPGLNKEFQTVGCLLRKDSVFYFLNGIEVNKRSIDTLQKNKMNIWLTSIASFLGNTKEVDDTKLPASAEFEFVRFYEERKKVTK